jgi:hypothetical protein
MQTPVIISLSEVIATTAELRMAGAAKAIARGNSHSSFPVAVLPLNMRMSALLAELEEDFPGWNRKGVPKPSGVFGCHLCNATLAAGAPVSTTTIESLKAEMAEAGTLHRSGKGIV